jgi:hypothetical protein
LIDGAELNKDKAGRPMQASRDEVGDFDIEPFKPVRIVGARFDVRGSAFRVASPPEFLSVSDPSSQHHRGTADQSPQIR